MRHPAIFLFVFSSILISQSSKAEDILADDFSAPKFDARKALRGDWKFENKEASCVADPELYKKFNNHGPILRWPVKMSDGGVEFEFRCVDVQRLVFTLNEKGHVFRMTFRDDGNSSIFGWIGQSSKENKPKVIAKKNVPSMQELNGKLWAVFRLKIKGDTAKVRVGKYAATLKHPSIAREKSEVTISFASGRMHVRDFKVTK